MLLYLGWLPAAPPDGLAQLLSAASCRRLSSQGASKVALDARFILLKSHEVKIIPGALRMAGLEEA